MNVIELKKPLMINGQNRKELTYDFDNLTCEAYSLAFAFADAKTLEATQAGKPSAAIMEQNGNLHMYLTMQAIITANPEISIDDLERIKGFDLVTLTQLGRNFINGRWEETSDLDDSGEESEHTAGLTVLE